MAVALHPEGVDRNLGDVLAAYLALNVALHPEGVDRNPCKVIEVLFHVRSPSTRRAWIEMLSASSSSRLYSVALHPEGVDRNLLSSLTVTIS